MNVRQATVAYEAWKRGQIPLIAGDLRRKHAAMRAGLFPFLRATFYRWIELWPRVCPELARVPRLLAVGDLHVENFGTWRDLEGRLVWGVNDFDEAARLAYTQDLVRLAVSARLAISDGQLEISCKAATAAILEGYADGLHDGRPYVLAGEHPALRRMAVARLKDPEPFWRKMLDWKRCPAPPVPLPWPEPRLQPRFVHRIAGLGSLGHERVVGIAAWRGGWVAREAKRLAPSSAAPGEPIRYADILQQAVRCPDPFVTIERGWLLRRLAPDCSRIELTALPAVRDEHRLLYAMGFETANVHGGANAPKAVSQDLHARPGRWLNQAAKAMESVVEADWRDYRG